MMMLLGKLSWIILHEKYLMNLFVDSINGVICVSVEQKDLFLWNSSIRKLNKMPTSRTGSIYMDGFGYDELLVDYILVDIL